MDFLKNIFKSKEETKPQPEKEVLDFKALSIIAAENARYLSALITTKTAMLVYYGKREVKKQKPMIDKLELKLEQELFYAEYYKSKGV